MQRLLKGLVDAHLALHLFQAEALGLWINEEHDEELQHHHGGEKVKGNGGMMESDHRKDAGKDGIADPVCGGAEALPFGAHACGEDLREVHPDDRALRDSEGDDVQNQ